MVDVPIGDTQWRFMNTPDFGYVDGSAQAPSDNDYFEGDYLISRHRTYLVRAVSLLD